MTDKTTTEEQLRAAKAEALLRWRISDAFRTARDQQRVSVRELASRIGTSKSQVQRLLHEEHGGSLTLTTIVRAAEALGLDVEVRVVPKLTHIKRTEK